MKLALVLGFLLCSSAWAVNGVVQVPAQPQPTAAQQPLPNNPNYTPAKDEPPFTLTQAGFQIGLNFSAVNVTNGQLLPNGTDTHTGLILGGQLEMSLLGNFLFLQPEFRLDQQGYSLDTVNGSNVTVNYLEIPILLKAKFQTMPGLHIFGLFGPNIGMKVGTSYDIAYGSTGGPPINLWNFALDFGAGAEYDLSQSVNFFGEVRYSVGLNNINGISGSPINETWRSFQLLTGLNFLL